MNLAFQSQWIDDLAKIIHHGIGDNLRTQGLLINLYLNNMTAIRIGGPVSGVFMQPVQRVAGRIICGNQPDQIFNCDRLVSACSSENTVRKLDIVLISLQMVSRKRQRRFSDQAGCLHQG